MEALVTAATVAERPQDVVVRRPIKGKRDWAKFGLGVYFVIFLLFLYLPMILMAILSFQGPNGQLTFPFRGPISTSGGSRSSTRRSRLDRRRSGGVREASLWLSLAAGAIVALLGFMLSMAFRRRWRYKTDVVAFYVIMLALMTPASRRARQPASLVGDGRAPESLEDRARRKRHLGDPVRVPRHARRLEPLRPADRGSGA